MNKLCTIGVLLVAVLIACKADLGPKVGEYNTLIIDIEEESAALEQLQLQAAMGSKSAAADVVDSGLEDELKRNVNRADDLRGQLEQDSAFAGQYYFEEYVTSRRLYGKDAFRRIVPVK